MPTIIALALSYLLGSLSSAIIISRLFGLQDPRQTGSGNAGATNMLRSAGKKMASYVLIGDVAKGLIAIYLASILGVHGFMLGVTAVVAVLGHIFPVFFGFKGGKGVATGAGAIIGLSLWIGLMILLIWLVIAAISRYASLASIVACIATPICMLIFQDAGYFIPTIILAAIVIWKHADNIRRLATGTEKKIYFNK